MSNHRVLNPADHSELRVHTQAGAELGDAAMAALVVPAEFRKVQSEYPIVFKRDEASGKFSALALFGFENGENLYLTDDSWDARYRPLSMAIQPFLIGRSANDDGQRHIHIDMAHPRVSSSGEGMRVFDEGGKPTPYLERIADMLGLLHESHEESAGFFAALERHDLLEPFRLDVPQADGGKNTMVGFHMINEAKLQDLGGDALADLHGEGHLLPIFMALASLSQLSPLVARKQARSTLG